MTPPNPGWGGRVGPKTTGVEDRSTGPTALVVDEDAAARRATTRVLEASGYAVLEAADGGAGLMTGAQYPGTIDLLVTDLVLEGMDGFSLAARLLAARPGLKVLYLSSPEAEPLVARERRLRSEPPWLAKPFRDRSFKRKLREVMRDPVDTSLAVFSRMLANPVAQAVQTPAFCPPGELPRGARYRVQLPVRFRTPDDPGWHQGVTENISRSGVLFVTQQPMSPGTVIDLELELPRAEQPAAERVRCSGEIVRAASSAQTVVAVAVRGYRLDP